MIYIVLEHFVSYYDELCFNCWDFVYFSNVFAYACSHKIVLSCVFIKSSKFYETNLFQRFLLLFITKKNIIFIAWGGRNLNKKHI